MGALPKDALDRPGNVQPARLTAVPPTVITPARRSRGPIALVRAGYDRFAHLVHELGKFGVVGAICYLIDITIFNLWLAEFHEPISAKTVSTAIAATIAFLGNRFWTWRDRERNGLGREYGLYFGFNAVGLAIGVACLWITHYGLGSIWPAVFTTTLADNISANVVGVLLASLFRFWAYRRFVFRPVAPPRP
jgi:putative flippase GtrA